MIRALKRDGWKQAGSSGSHQHFRHTTKTGKVTVPVHGGKDLKPFVVKSILRQAVLTEDELKELL
ncbi:MAG: type II toxin-antitoxin system HicA family toxin [Chloroflexia bacterium]|nr:type II toxin-antitoxin system HicA family toxin [Chloroflexia bacterium]